MKTTMALLAVAIATAGISCGGSTTPPSPNAPVAEGGTPLVAPVPAGPQNGVNTARVDTGDVPPVGARFHLFCETIDGPDHAIRAKQRKEQFIQATGLHGWHLVHSEDQSSIYFGYYRSISADDVKPDPQEIARAQADLKRISEMKNGQDDRLFQRTMFVPISEPDPVAPAEWNLANARPDAYWSLEIAAYRGIPLPGNPDRKTAAVETVREMRRLGIEGYFYHGETVSSVCVGVWPRTAVKEQEKDHVDGDARKNLIVIPPNTSQEVAEKIQREHPNSIIVTQKVEIADPSLLKAMETYPTHALNGFDYQKTSGGKQVVDPSLLVLVPRAQGTDAQASAPRVTAPRDRSAASGIDDAAFDAIRSQRPPAVQPTPRRGRLNSIDNP